MDLSIDQSVASSVLPDGEISPVVRSVRIIERATRRMGDPVNSAIVSSLRASTKYRVEAADATAAKPVATTTALVRPKSNNQPTTNAATAVVVTNGSHRRVRCHMYTAFAISTPGPRRPCADLMSRVRLMGQVNVYRLWGHGNTATPQRNWRGYLVPYWITGRRRAPEAWTIRRCRAMHLQNRGTRATVQESLQRQGQRQQSRRGFLR